MASLGCVCVCVRARDASSSLTRRRRRAQDGDGGFGRQRRILLAALARDGARRATRRPRARAKVARITTAAVVFVVVVVVENLPHEFLLARALVHALNSSSKTRAPILAFAYCRQPSF